VLVACLACSAANLRDLDRAEFGDYRGAAFAPAGSVHQPIYNKFLMSARRDAGMASELARVRAQTLPSKPPCSFQLAKRRAELTLAARWVVQVT
jgi:hypothetical protein